MLHLRHATLDDLDTLSNLFDKYRVWHSQPSDLAASFARLYRFFSGGRMRRLWILNGLPGRADFRGRPDAAQRLYGDYGFQRDLLTVGEEA